MHMITLLLRIVAVFTVLAICAILWMAANSWYTNAKSTFNRDIQKFAPCPASPNCVSTQAVSSDSEHFIAPIPFTGTAEEAKARLLKVLQQMPRTKLLADEGNYIQVETRTAVMRFVDDVEFYIDSASQTIQFRSASRIGYGDMGTNRKRMEEIRAKFAE